MITIDRAAYAAMLDHLQQAAPREGVGLLAGPAPEPCGLDTNGDGDCGRRSCPYCWPSPADRRRCDRWVPLANVADYPRARYRVDDGHLLAAWNALHDDGRRPWIVVHSHTTTSAAPSAYDVEHAADPTLLHMIVSLAGAAPYPVLWRLDPAAEAGQMVEKIRFQVIDLGFQGNPPTDLTHGVTGPIV